MLKKNQNHQNDFPLYHVWCRRRLFPLPMRVLPSSHTHQCKKKKKGICKRRQWFGGYIGQEQVSRVELVRLRSFGQRANHSPLQSLSEGSINPFIQKRIQGLTQKFFVLSAFHPHGNCVSGDFKLYFLQMHELIPIRISRNDYVTHSVILLWCLRMSRQNNLFIMLCTLLLSFVHFLSSVTAPLIGLAYTRHSFHWVCFKN